MKLRAVIPRIEGIEDATLLHAMREPFRVMLLGESVGAARVIDMGESSFEIEIALDPGVEMDVDVGHYTPAAQTATKEEQE